MVIRVPDDRSGGGSRSPRITPTPPPRPRTKPFEDRPGLRDLYRRAPKGDSGRTTPTPAPDRGTRDRRRYERDVDAVRPTPQPRSGAPVPGDGNRPGPSPRPRISPAPAPRPRSRVVPRYGSPKSGLPDRRARDNRFRDGNRDRSVAPGLRLRQAASRTQRDSASWTWGRGERRFNGGDPWGVNAAGRRIYGTWRRNHFAPTCFYWGYVPAWCRWGYFCYPAYASWYYPYYCWPSLWSSSFVFHWNSQDIYRNRLWYWPSSVYTPSIVYYDYDYPPDYYDAGGYAVVESGAAAPTAIRVGRGAGRAAPPSKETLAERHVALGDFYFKEERYDDAAESYMRALAYAPDDPGLHFVLADALFAVGDYHYAAFMIRKAIDLDPEMVTVVADKRGFYAKPERFDAQMETLRRYLAEKPYDAAAHLVLGYNLRLTGEKAEARKAFARVLEIDAHQEAAKLYLDALPAAEAGTDEGAGKEPPAAEPEAADRKDG